MFTYIKFWLEKQYRFKWHCFNKRYMDGYNFALKKLKNGMCARCLVANSVGPDNHDDGLRDACQDFSRFYHNKQKKDCTKIMTCKH